MQKRKLLAVLIVLIALIVGATGGWSRFFSVFFLSFISLVLIIFSEGAGSFIGLIGLLRPSRITKESPAGMVEFIGWVLLIMSVVTLFSGKFDSA